MIRKASVAVALATMVAVSACGDVSSPPVGQPQRYIAANNNPIITTDWGDMTVLDALLKETYERNNNLSRRGEADNTAASNANLNLAKVFMWYSSGAVSLTDARNYVQSFIKDINTALKGGKYSNCAAPQLVARAQQIDATLAAVQANNNTLSEGMLPGPPNWDCDVSPVEFAAATGSSTNGVSLIFNDPWHFHNDPENIQTVYVRFDVQRWNPADATWITVPQSQYGNEFQTGATTLTFTDPITTPGDYLYQARQCDITYGGCSLWAEGTVTVPDPNSGGGGGGGEFSCVHDNRNGFMTKDNKTKPCPKVDKIHPNINGNGKK